MTQNYSEAQAAQSGHPPHRPNAAIAAQKAAIHCDAEYANTQTFLSLEITTILDTSDQQ